jgi:hypothetical protein
MNAPGKNTVSAGKARVLEFPSFRQEDTRLLLPREHGSWALWLLPLVSGGIVGYISGTGSGAAPALWFSAVAIAAFLIHQPLESLLGLSVIKVRSLREQQIAVFWVVGLTMLAVLGVLKLLQWRRGWIFVFALVALGCFGLAALFGHARSWRVPKQLVGAAGLTSTAAGAYYVTTGRVDATALLLWLAFWLFAAGQIEYVQLRLRTAHAKNRGSKARAGWKLCFFHLLAVAATLIGVFAAGMPPLFSLAFVPATVRLFIWMARPARPLRLYILGFSELLQSIAFAALLTAAFLAI